jgi:hypothetical protein
MTWINIEAYSKLNDKYQNLLEYHATKIWDNEIHNEFAYHDQERTLNDLFETFKDKEIAHDIYTKFIIMAQQEGYLCESSY